MSQFDEHHLDKPLSPHRKSSCDSDSSDDAGRHHKQIQKKTMSSSSSDSDSGIDNSSHKIKVDQHIDLHHDEKVDDIHKDNLEV